MSIDKEKIMTIYRKFYSDDKNEFEKEAYDDLQTIVNNGILLFPHMNEREQKILMYGIYGGIGICRKRPGETL